MDVPFDRDIEKAVPMNRNTADTHEIGWSLNKQFTLQNHFPWLTDDLAVKYKAHQKVYLDIFAVSPMVIIIYVIVATRMNLQHVGSSSTLFSLAFASMVLVTTVFSIFASAHVCKLYWRRSEDAWKKSWAVSSEKFLLTSFWGRIEDFIGVLATLIAGFYLIARVQAGQCPTGNVWDTQTCNPVADLHSIPTDQVIYLYTVPFMCQIVLRGFSVTAMM